jgi:hypothetical protein
MIRCTSISAYILAGLVLQGALLGQQKPVVVQQIRQPDLFFMLFRSVAEPVLQQDSKIPLGASANLIRRYQDLAKLTDDQVQILLETALICVRQVREIDQKASEITTAAREAAREEVKRSGKVPPPPAELAELQKQKQNVIEQNVNDLRGGLGVDAYDRLSSVLSNQNANDNGREQASMSISIPPELMIPAPPESRINRPDFKMPQESLYESKLPVKIMITPAGATGNEEKLQFGEGEYIYLRVTLLNTVREPMVLHIPEILSYYSVNVTKNGQRLLGSEPKVTLDLLPAFAKASVIDIPDGIPFAIGTVRLERKAQFDLSDGKYTFVLQRDFALRPAVNKEQEDLYKEIGYCALKSNTVSVAIQK